MGKMTCGEHAKMMATLVSPAQMGPNTKAIYDRLMRVEGEECLASEDQIIMMFMAAMNKDGQTADQGWSDALDFGRVG